MYSPQGFPIMMGMAGMPQSQRTSMGGSLAELSNPLRGSVQGAVDESAVFGQLPQWAQEYFNAQGPMGGTIEDRISQFLPDYQSIVGQLASVGADVPYAFRDGNYGASLSSPVSQSGYFKGPGSDSVLYEGTTNFDPITGTPTYFLSGNKKFMPTMNDFKVRRPFQPDTPDLGLYSEARLNYNKLLNSATSLPEEAFRSNPSLNQMALNDWARMSRRGAF